MKNNRLIILVLLAVAVILAAILAVIRTRTEPGIPDVVAVLPVPSDPVTSPEGMTPAVPGGHRTPLPETVDPRYDAREEARVAQRVQALIDGVAPVRHDDITNVAPEFVVTPEEGLRRMAESTGMPVDERALKPYSKADFIREAAPADPPQP